MGRILPTLQYSLDLGCGDAHGTTVNPQGVVGDSRQVAFPIADQELGGCWGERGPQAGATLGPWHREQPRAWRVQDPGGT